MSPTALPDALPRAALKLPITMSLGPALPAHPAASQSATVTEETVPSAVRCPPSSGLDLSLTGKGAVTLTGSDTYYDIPTCMKG